MLTKTEVLKELREMRDMNKEKINASNDVTEKEWFTGKRDAYDYAISLVNEMRDDDE